jgi:hypothetical protein
MCRHPRVGTNGDVDRREVHLIDRLNPLQLTP